MPADHSHLTIKFHGRIIDHLGIQMYQSPTAAIAELVANAWDADADTVDIQLPATIQGGAEILIHDDGDGMTFQECEDRYLNVGYNRRGTNAAETTKKGRPTLGRKGIGKFAGFGIARKLVIDTTSGATGERTVFELDLDTLRGNQYVVKGGKIDVSKYDGPNESRKKSKGTIIKLGQLTLARRPSESQFRVSLARRFLLQEFATGFAVTVNQEAIPTLSGLSNVEFDFPNAYEDSERPESTKIENGWGIETLSNGHEIKWRFMFLKDPIEDEEMRGVSVFANVKLAQVPFFFNLTGGLGGQHGQEYLTGQVRADYIDSLEADIIATERQRINWENPEAAPLLAWGQKRVQQLLRVWQERRGAQRRRQLEEKVAGFSARLERLPAHERRTVRRALERLGGIPALSEQQFLDMGESILLAWESGRLRALIDALAENDDLTSEVFLSYLAEADVLTALNAAEAIRTRLEAITALRTLVNKGELENAVRDYIAEKPYLLDPKWETFKRETSLKHIVDQAAEEVGMASDDTVERKRVDLVLRSNEQLLVVEFMRPGLKADWDHVSRCERYILRIRDKIESQTALGIDPNKITGLFVADDIEDKPDIRKKIATLTSIDIYAHDWNSLLSQAERKWRDFLFLLKERAPDDQRIAKLADV